MEFQVNYTLTAKEDHTCGHTRGTDTHTHTSETPTIHNLTHRAQTSNKRSILRPWPRRMSGTLSTGHSPHLQQTRAVGGGLDWESLLPSLPRSPRPPLPPPQPQRPGSTWRPPLASQARPSPQAALPAR